MCVCFEKQQIEEEDGSSFETETRDALMHENGLAQWGLSVTTGTCHFYYEAEACPSEHTYIYIL